MGLFDLSSVPSIGSNCERLESCLPLHVAYTLAGRSLNLFIRAVIPSGAKDSLPAAGRCSCSRFVMLTKVSIPLITHNHSILFLRYFLCRQKVSKKLVRFEAISLREPRLESTSCLFWLALRCFQPSRDFGTGKAHNKKIGKNFCCAHSEGVTCL
jgi:hypothetical protein